MWILVLITLMSSNLVVDKVAIYDTMELCFDERQKLIESIGRPIVNYQAICLRTTDSNNE